MSALRACLALTAQRETEEAANPIIYQVMINVTLSINAFKNYTLVIAEIKTFCHKLNISPTKLPIHGYYCTAIFTIYCVYCTLLQYSKLIKKL